MAPRLELFPFRYRDPRTGKCVRARYYAQRHEIAARYSEWKITGPAEVRDVDPAAQAFTPNTSFKLMMDAELQRYTERPPELQPATTRPRRSCSRYSSAGTSPIAPGAASLPR